MPRSDTRIRKGDVERAIAGARAGGLCIEKVEIDARNQRIIIITGEASTRTNDELDAELAAFEARNEDHS